MQFDKARREYRNYCVSIWSPRDDADRKTNVPVTFTNFSSLNYVKSDDIETDKMFKLEFDRAVGNDQEYH